MASYLEHDLPGLPDPLCRRAAARVGYLDNLISAAAFLMAYPWPDDFEIDPSSSLSQQYLIPEGKPAERKARADEIATRVGAATEWRNGYYMARLNCVTMDVKIHFYPPIFLADVGDDDADEAA
jgi:hypothetical protein